jgi:hypothetical protein
MSTKPSFYNTSHDANTSQNINKSCCQCKCASYEVANIDLLKVKEEHVDKSYITNVEVKENVIVGLDMKVKDDLNVIGETCLENTLTIKPPCGSTSTTTTTITNNSIDVSNILQVNTDGSGNVVVKNRLITEALQFNPIPIDSGIINLENGSVSATTVNITGIINAQEGDYVVIINTSTSDITVHNSIMADSSSYKISGKHSSSMIYYDGKLYSLHGTKH